MKNQFKYYKTLLFLGFTVAFMISCQEDDSPQLEEVGEMIVKFENYVGSQPLQLDDEGSTDYSYTNANGQAFNITRFGYYISHVKLEGPSGEIFIDEMKVSANEAELKGYYRVVQGDEDTYNVHLKNIPAGQYNRIIFTLGVEEDGVIEGAVGGILDRAAGAWFWNWNSGFINILLEGHSPASPRDANTIKLHVGGWKDIPAEGGQSQRFFNNNVEISLPFDATVRVNQTLRPSPHIHMDLMKWIADVNLEMVNDVHSPAAGRALTPRLVEAFYVDHTHQ